MATSGVIPLISRYGRLKQVVFGLADSLVKLPAEKANLSPSQANNLRLLAYPWLGDEPKLTAEQQNILEQNRKLLTLLGLDGEKIAAELRDVLANDRHLAQCCLTPLGLADYLGSSIVGRIAAEKRAGNAADRLDLLYDEFETSTYEEGQFKRITLSHLFNFEMEGNSNSIDDVRIERLTPDTIPKIIGEPGYQAFLHPLRVGDCFIVSEDETSSVPDMDWMRAERERAILFGNLLQFYKDGVVHVAYSAIYFSPEWVNKIRKPPLFFLGTPRQVSYEGGSQRWTMMTPDKEELTCWWMLMKTPTIAAALANKSGKLREAIYRAASYFDESHQKAGLTERLIALAIALESLFSPSDKENLSFRISQSAAQFLGSDAADRRQIFEDLREMYRRRSKLFHGTYDVKRYEDGTFVTAKEIALWSNYIRRALLGFLTLHFRGESSRDDLLSLTEQASLDPTVGDTLRRRSSVHLLIEELSPKNP
jgi:hypothetical protein